MELTKHCKEKTFLNAGTYRQSSELRSTRRRSNCMTILYSADLGTGLESQRKWITFTCEEIGYI